MDLNECISFMMEKHDGQKRKHGTPYYHHPLEVSNILRNKGFSLEYQVVGLFHDLLEDTDATIDEIRYLSNDRVVDAVILLTKDVDYVMSEYIGNIKKNDMARIVKLVDRIHNLSEVQLASYEFQQKYIKETEEWFLDLAMGTIFDDDMNQSLNKIKRKIKSL